MGKTAEAKPHHVNLRSPLSRIYYYKNKRLQVKRISVPNTNLQLNPYPNTQLDLYCSGNLSIQFTNSSIWLTNDARIPVRDQHTNLRKNVGCKVFQFINNEDQEAPWSQNPWRKDEVASAENMMNYSKFCLRSQYAFILFSTPCIIYDSP